MRRQKKEAGRGRRRQRGEGRGRGRRKWGERQWLAEKPRLKTRRPLLRQGLDRTG